MMVLERQLYVILSLLMHSISVVQSQKVCRAQSPVRLTLVQPVMFVKLRQFSIVCVWQRAAEQDMEAEKEVNFITFAK
jgi:hypothetical protein